jgi:putative chitinase
MPVVAKDIVARIAPQAHPVYREAFEDRQGLLAEFGITTPLRFSHFLAQAFVETGGLAKLVESGVYSAKGLGKQWDIGNWHSFFASRDECVAMAEQCKRDKGEALFNRVYMRKTLGNVSPGDGWKFRGRGIIQTTGRANYKGLGKTFKVGFEDEPDLVATPSHALKAALGHWRAKHLNAAADANDIAVITKGINGGLGALDERKAAFARIFSVAKDNRAIEESTEWQVQEKLNAAGFPCGKPDGVIGKDTRAAILAYRAKRGLPMTTAITPDLLRSLGVG